MVTESPPVSPSVVAAILMIQKISVTSGTLVSAIRASLRISRFAFHHSPPTKGQRSRRDDVPGPERPSPEFPVLGQQASWKSGLNPGRLVGNRFAYGFS